MHPGLINRYPELKGLNPQRRASTLSYPYIGCVLHKVNDIVDSGEIVLYESIKNTYCLEQNYKLLKIISLKIWVDFLSPIFKKPLIK